MDEFQTTTDGFHSIGKELRKNIGVDAGYSGSLGDAVGCIVGQTKQTPEQYLADKQARPELMVELLGKRVAYHRHELHILQDLENKVRHNSHAITVDELRRVLKL